MKTPIPPDAIPSGSPSADHRSPPAAEPVHAVRFTPPRSDAQHPSNRSQKPVRGWILAVALILLLAVGGWLLHHLQQHPLRPPTEPADRQEPPASEPTDIADAPSTDSSDDSQPSEPRAPVEPPADRAEETPRLPPAPVQQNTMPEPAGEPAAEPQATREESRNSSDPRADTSRQPFEALLSQGLAQLHQGQYQQARTTLLEAAAMDPGSAAVREALTQADQALKLAQLDRLRRQATAAEQNGEWSTALERYVAALAVDPNVGFALRGKRHATQRITIARRIDFYLTQPETLLNDRHLGNAVQLLSDAGEITPRDAELAAMMEHLDRLLTAAQTPVPVTLTSDNLTEVAVYRVGRMGRFDARDLNLRPGTYTVVGTRDGYRDVRLTVTISPGTTPPAVHVVCTEAIDANAHR
jgi:hypothetical protein